MGIPDQKGDTPCSGITPLLKIIGQVIIYVTARPLWETGSYSLDHISRGHKGPPPLFWHHASFSPLDSHKPPQWTLNGGWPVMTWDPYCTPPGAALKTLQFKLMISFFGPNFTSRKHKINLKDFFKLHNWLKVTAILSGASQMAGTSSECYPTGGSKETVTSNMSLTD